MKAVAAPEDSLLSLAASEPERTRMVLKAAAIGCVLVAAWVLLASWLLPLIAFLPLTFVVLVIDAAALVLLTGRVVHAADRWRLESASQARQFLNSGHPRPAELTPVKLATPAAVAAPEYANANDFSDGGEAFQRLYFALRLDHEVVRCRREGNVISVVVLEISHPSADPRPAELEKMVFDIAKLATDHGRTVVMPTYIGPSQYAFYVPEAKKAEARAQVFPLLKALGSYHSEAGFASYPGDGNDGETLLTAAMEELEGTRSVQQAVSARR